MTSDKFIGNSQGIHRESAVNSNELKRIQTNQKPLKSGEEGGRHESEHLPFVLVLAHCSQIDCEHRFALIIHWIQFGSIRFGSLHAHTAHTNWLLEGDQRRDRKRSAADLALGRSGSRRVQVIPMVAGS